MAASGGGGQPRAGHHNAWAVCLYDRLALTDERVDDLCATHPLMWSGRQHQLNDRYQDPTRFIAEHRDASPDPVDLTGWHLVDRALHVGPVPAGVLDPGATLLVHLPPTVQLGNKGGEITLLNNTGLKIHGVAYTADQASHSGWTVVF